MTGSSRRIWRRRPGATLGSFVWRCVRRDRWKGKGKGGGFGMGCMVLNGYPRLRFESIGFSLLGICMQCLKAPLY